MAPVQKSTAQSRTASGVEEQAATCEARHATSRARISEIKRRLGRDVEAERKIEQVEMKVTKQLKAVWAVWAVVLGESYKHLLENKHL
jgi:hypothetical protein